MLRRVHQHGVDALGRHLTDLPRRRCPVLRGVGMTAVALSLEGGPPALASRQPASAASRRCRRSTLAGWLRRTLRCSRRLRADERGPDEERSGCCAADYGRSMVTNHRSLSRQSKVAPQLALESVLQTRPRRSRRKRPADGDVRVPPPMTVAYQSTAGSSA